MSQGTTSFRLEWRSRIDQYDLGGKLVVSATVEMAATQNVEGTDDSGRRVRVTSKRTVFFAVQLHFAGEHMKLPPEVTRTAESNVCKL